MGFGHPERVELPTGHHLRPIRADDVETTPSSTTGRRKLLGCVYIDPPEPSPPACTDAVVS